MGERLAVKKLMFVTDVLLREGQLFVALRFVRLLFYLMKGTIDARCCGCVAAFS